MSTRKNKQSKVGSIRLVNLNSIAAQKLLYDIKQTNYDENFTDRYWRTKETFMVENDTLVQRYQDYISDQQKMGRSEEMFKESYLFTYETERSCTEICQGGQRVCLKRRHVLGHTGSGVHLVKHYDILTRYMAQQNTTTPVYVMVYKVYLGKNKPIVPRLHKDDNYVMPAFGFDCHISARKVDPKMPICEAFNCSYVYIYEHDEISSNTIKCPRQILPYAIINLEKKIPMMLEIPLLAVGTNSAVSDWEVKGETRRGFRFLYTKPKTKPKVDDVVESTACQTKKLKEQLIEMRTKSDVAHPPVLQRVSDNNTKHTEDTTPPKINCLSNVPTTSEADIDDIGKDAGTQNTRANMEKFEGVDIKKIKCTFEQSKQLLSLRPLVKVKRLHTYLETEKRERKKRGRPRKHEKGKGFENNSVDINPSCSNKSHETSVVGNKKKCVSESVRLHEKDTKTQTHTVNQADMNSPKETIPVIPKSIDKEKTYTPNIPSVVIELDDEPCQPTEQSNNGISAKENKLETVLHNKTINITKPEQCIAPRNVTSKQTTEHISKEPMPQNIVDKAVTKSKNGSQVKETKSGQSSKISSPVPAIVAPQVLDKVPSVISASTQEDLLDKYEDLFGFKERLTRKYKNDVTQQHVSNSANVKDNNKVCNKLQLSKMTRSISVTNSVRSPHLYTVCGYASRVKDKLEFLVSKNKSQGSQTYAQKTLHNVVSFDKPMGGLHKNNRCSKKKTPAFQPDTNKPTTYYNSEHKHIESDRESNKSRHETIGSSSKTQALSNNKREARQYTECSSSTNNLLSRTKHELGITVAHTKSFRPEELQKRDKGNKKGNKAGSNKPPVIQDKVHVNDTKGNSAEHCLHLNKTGISGDNTDNDTSPENMKNNPMSPATKSIYNTILCDKSGSLLTTWESYTNPDGHIDCSNDVVNTKANDETTDKHEMNISKYELSRTTNSQTCTPTTSKPIRHSGGTVEKMAIKYLDDDSKYGRKKDQVITQGIDNTIISRGTPDVIQGVTRKKKSETINSVTVTNNVNEITKISDGKKIQTVCIEPSNKDKFDHCELSIESTNEKRVPTNLGTLLANPTIHNKESDAHMYRATNSSDLRTTSLTIATLCITGNLTDKATKDIGRQQSANTSSPLNIVINQSSKAKVTEDGENIQRLVKSTKTSNVVPTKSQDSLQIKELNQNNPMNNENLLKTSGERGDKIKSQQGAIEQVKVSDILKASDRKLGCNTDQENVRESDTHLSQETNSKLNSENKVTWKARTHQQNIDSVVNLQNASLKVASPTITANTTDKDTSDIGRQPSVNTVSPSNNVTNKNSKFEITEEVDIQRLVESTKDCKPISAKRRDPIQSKEPDMHLSRKSNSKQNSENRVTPKASTQLQNTDKIANLKNTSLKVATTPTTTNTTDTSVKNIGQQQSCNRSSPSNSVTIKRSKSKITEEVEIIQRLVESTKDLKTVLAKGKHSIEINELNQSHSINYENIPKNAGERGDTVKTQQGVMEQTTISENPNTNDGKLGTSNGQENIKEPDAAQSQEANSKLKSENRVTSKASAQQQNITKVANLQNASLQVATTSPTANATNKSVKNIGWQQSSNMAYPSNRATNQSSKSKVTDDVENIQRLVESAKDSKTVPIKNQESKQGKEFDQGNYINNDNIPTTDIEIGDTIKMQHVLTAKAKIHLNPKASSRKLGRSTDKTNIKETDTQLSRESNSNRNIEKASNQQQNTKKNANIQNKSLKVTTTSASVNTTDKAIKDIGLKQSGNLSSPLNSVTNKCSKSKVTDDDENLQRLVKSAKDSRTVTAKSEESSNQGKELDQGNSMNNENLPKTASERGDNINTQYDTTEQGKVSENPNASDRKLESSTDQKMCKMCEHGKMYNRDRTPSNVCKDENIKEDTNSRTVPLLVDKTQVTFNEHSINITEVKTTSDISRPTEEQSAVVKKVNKDTISKTSDKPKDFKMANESVKTTKDSQKNVSDRTYPVLNNSVMKIDHAKTLDKPIINKDVANRLRSFLSTKVAALPLHTRQQILEGWEKRLCKQTTILNNHEHSVKTYQHIVENGNKSSLDKNIDLADRDTSTQSKDGKTDRTSAINTVVSTKSAPPDTRTYTSNDNDMKTSTVNKKDERQNDECIMSREKQYSSEASKNSVNLPSNENRLVKSESSQISLFHQLPNINEDKPMIKNRTAISDEISCKSASNDLRYTSASTENQGTNHYHSDNTRIMESCSAIPKQEPIDDMFNENHGHIKSNGENPSQVEHNLRNGNSGTEAQRVLSVDVKREAFESNFQSQTENTEYNKEVHPIITKSTQVGSSEHLYSKENNLECTSQVENNVRNENSGTDVQRSILVNVKQEAFVTKFTLQSKTIENNKEMAPIITQQTQLRSSEPSRCADNNVEDTSQVEHNGRSENSGTEAQSVLSVNVKQEAFATNFPLPSENTELNKEVPPIVTETLTVDSSEPLTSGSKPSNGEKANSLLVQTLTELAVVLQKISNKSKAEIENRKREFCAAGNNTIQGFVKTKQYSGNERTLLKGTHDPSTSCKKDDGSVSLRPTCVSVNSYHQGYPQGASGTLVERDVLPELFDRDGEADITNIEQFGLPNNETIKSKRRSTKKPQLNSARKTKLRALLKQTLTKKVNIDQSQQGNNRETSEKLQTHKKSNITDKSGRTFASFKILKAGLLNRGFKQRKNMFDLKINSSKRPSYNFLLDPTTDKHQPSSTSFEEKQHKEILHQNIPQSFDTTECNNNVTGTGNSECPKQQEPVVEGKCDSVKPSKTKGLETSLEKTVEVTKLERPGNLPTVLPSVMPETQENVKNDVGTKQNSTDTDNNDTIVTTLSSPQRDPTSKSNGLERNTVKPSRTRKGTKPSTKTDDSLILPFSKVMELKRKQYYRFKKGFARTPFINYKRLGHETYHSKSKGDKNDQSKSATSSVSSSRRSRSRSRINDCFYDGSSSKERSAGKRKHSENYKTDSFTTDEAVKRQKFMSTRSEDTVLIEDFDEPPLNSQRIYQPYKFSFRNKRFQNTQGGFRKSGTGFFSWKRKYNSKRDFMKDRFQTPEGPPYVINPRYGDSMQNPLNSQVETCFREFSRAFSCNTETHFDEAKMATFFKYMAEKMDVLHKKRQASIYNRSTRGQISRPVLSRHAYTFRNQLRQEGLFSDPIHKKQELFPDTIPKRHVENMEDLLKQHLNQHYDNMTIKIRENLMQELTESLVTNLKPDLQSMLETSPLFGRPFGSPGLSGKFQNDDRIPMVGPSNISMYQTHKNRRKSIEDIDESISENQLSPRFDNDHRLADSYHCDGDQDRRKSKRHPHHNYSPRSRDKYDRHPYDRPPRDNQRTRDDFVKNVTKQRYCRDDLNHPGRGVKNRSVDPRELDDLEHDNIVETVAQGIRTIRGIEEERDGHKSDNRSRTRKHGSPGRRTPSHRRSLSNSSDNNRDSDYSKDRSNYSNDKSHYSKDKSHYSKDKTKYSTDQSRHKHDDILTEDSELDARRYSSFDRQNGDRPKGRYGPPKAPFESYRGRGRCRGRFNFFSPHGGRAAFHHSHRPFYKSYHSKYDRYHDYSRNDKDYRDKGRYRGDKYESRHYNDRRRESSNDRYERPRHPRENKHRNDDVRDKDIKKESENGGGTAQPILTLCTSR